MATILDCADLKHCHRHRHFHLTALLSRVTGVLGAAGIPGDCGVRGEGRRKGAAPASRGGVWNGDRGTNADGDKYVVLREPRRQQRQQPTTFQKICGTCCFKIVLAFLPPQAFFHGCLLLGTLLLPAPTPVQVLPSVLRPHTAPPHTTVNPESRNQKETEPDTSGFVRFIRKTFFFFFTD